LCKRPENTFGWSHEDEKTGFAQETVVFAQDNARSHIAAVALAALTEIGGTARKHPPYSPDLVPRDFWAFPTLKRQLRRKRFSSDD